ncbi:MAG: alanyl-tRNA editing protein [Planctomycetota bacterium]|jgi:alanyl-tRNA synthetase
MTRRLFHEDPYRIKFTARVVERTPDGVVLDETCFYPAGGGQPHDTGRLNGVRVREVVEDGGKIVHRTDGPVEGDEVRGEIDWERRRDHMQQHHGQHLLSQAFLLEAGAQTVSFHLGAESSTIELDKAAAGDVVGRAEEIVNRIVVENRAVTAGFHTREEALKLPSRKPPPEGEERVRIVQVEDFECQACCGTHPKRTGEAGMLLVTGVEGKVVHFICGFRALRRARRDAAVLKALSLKLSTGPEEMEEAIDRIQRQAGEHRRTAQGAEKQLARYRAREFTSAAKPQGRARIVREIFKDRDIRYLQALANEMIAEEGIVALLGGTGEKSSIVLACHRELGLDLRPVLKETLALIDGRGGGKSHFVQGGGGGKDVGAALKKAESLIAGNL